MMQIPEGEFRFPSISSVVFGQGSVRRLREKTEQLGVRRALVVTGSSILTKTDLVDRIKNVLGERYAGVFSGVKQHVPRQCVIDGARMAREVGADILISLGGSSPADAAKAINLVLTEEELLDSFFDKFDRLNAIPASQYEKIKLYQIAIPTTLSAGEFRPAAGITDTERKVKEAIHDTKLVPKVIILDPEMTASTPSDLWASTGLKTLSDSFSNVCSPMPLPFSDALELHSIRLINQYLVPSIREPLDSGARAMLLHAVWESVYGGNSMGLGLIAALRHQIGGGYNVAHGIASTIVFPYCLDFYRPLIDERLMLIAEALDLPVKGASITASAVVDRVRELIVETDLPTRLRDVGITRDSFPAIAEATSHDFSVGSSLIKIDAKQILGILEQAW